MIFKSNSLLQLYSTKILKFPVLFSLAFFANRNMNLTTRASDWKNGDDNIITATGKKLAMDRDLLEQTEGDKTPFYTSPGHLHYL